MHGNEPVSDWVRRFTPLLRANASVLDLACGAGRHARWFLQQGHAVTGIDRDAAALGMTAAQSGWRPVLADIENGPWPLGDERFDAVVVTHYLWRPLLPRILASVAPGGLLLYETFAAGNETVGKPSRPDFLLRNGELLTLCAGWRIVAYEDGFLEPPARFVQRIAALHTPPDSAPARHGL